MTFIPSSVDFSTNVTVTTTTETIVAQIDNVTTPRAGCKVRLFGNLQLTTGADTTAVTVRWRRGTAITDTLVGEANAQQVVAAAGSTEELTHAVEDEPGEVAKQSYVLTVQQTAATANGTALAGEAWADIAC